MEKILMIKDDMVHYVPYESVTDFINCGWVKADLTKKECKKNTTKETAKATNKRTKKSN